MKLLDPALAERVKHLRVELGLNQIEFASLIKATRTQVGEWERGLKERPSVGKIIEMASLAPTKEDRIWFLEKAGVNLDSVKADFREDLRTRAAQRDPNKTVDIPVFRHLSHDRDGKLKYTRDGSVALPSNLIEHPGSLACFASEKRRPWINRDGDLVLIDRSLTEPKDLWEEPAGVFFSALPVTNEALLRALPLPLGMSAGPRVPFIEPQIPPKYRTNKSKLYPTADALSAPNSPYAQLIKDAMGPGFLVGWLHVVLADDEPDVIFATSNPPWRLVLTVQSPLSSFCPRIALSEWRHTHWPDTEHLTISQAPLLPGIQILGQVVGWLRKEAS